MPKTQAQIPEGTWISIYTRYFPEIIDFPFDGLVPMDSSIAKQPRSYAYEEVTSIIEFLDGQVIEARPLGEPSRRFNYHLENDSLFVMMDSNRVYMQYKEGKLALLDPTPGEGLPGIFFEPLNPVGNLKWPTKNATTGFVNTHWHFKVDSLSRHHGIQFFFVDEINAFILYTVNGKLYVSKATYRVLESQGNLFFYYMNLDNLDRGIIRFYKQENGNLFGQTFEVEDDQTGNYKTTHLRMEKSKLPGKRKMKKLKSLLTGNWTAQSEFDISDFEYYGLKNYEDQFFRLNLSDQGSFQLEYGGLLSNEKGPFPYKKSLSGQWSISPTGNFLNLRIENRYSLYLPLISVKRNAIKLSLPYEYPSDETGTFTHSTTEFFNLSKR